MRGFTGITLISLLLISCTKDLQSEYELKILHLNPENAKSEINDAIKEISYLKLSTDNKSYIGTISKLLIEDDKIFVLDGEQALAIFVFAMDGELLYKIDAYGSGPGEFRGPRDIGINKENNTIIVYDMASIKLSYYKLDNGTYMHEKILPFAPSRFATSNHGYVFFNNNSISGEDEFNLSITDTGFQFIEKALPINPNLRGFFYNTPRNFTRYGNQLFFTQPFDNTVYKVDSNKVNEFLKIDFGKYNLSSKFYDAYNNNRDRLKTRENSAFNVTNYFETNYFRFFNYSTTSNTFYYIKSKESKKEIHTTYDYLVNNLEIGRLTRWPIAVYNDKYLIWYQQPSELLKYISEKREALDAEEWNQFETQNEKLLNFAATLSENDNPYLIFMEIDF